MDEVKSHTEMEHWKIVARTAILEGMKILHSVWAMQRKPG
jgi:hypothetical protein